jgi:hypothetical protein
MVLVGVHEYVVFEVVVVFAVRVPHVYVPVCVSAKTWAFAVAPASVPSPYGSPLFENVSWWKANVPTNPPNDTVSLVDSSVRSTYKVYASPELAPDSVNDPDASPFSKTNDVFFVLPWYILP